MKKIKVVLVAFLIMFCGTILLVGCSSDKKYDITVMDCEHGVITVNKSEAKEGEKVLVSTISELGYELAVITINGQPLASTTFEMPGKDVTINALFNAKTGSTNDVELIDYKLGLYTCDSDISLDGLGRKGFAATYNMVTLKENNKADFKGYINGELAEVKDLIYARKGNTLIASFGAYNVQILLCDESTFVIKMDNFMQVYSCKENIEIPLNTYSAYMEINGRGTQYLIQFLENSRMEVVSYIDSTTFETMSLTYELYGNRIFFALEGRVYVAKLHFYYDNEYMEMFDLGYFKDGFHLIEEELVCAINEVEVLLGNYCVNFVNGEETFLSGSYYDYLFDGLTINNDYTLDIAYRNIDYSYVVGKGLPYKQIGELLLTEINGQKLALSCSRYEEVIYLKFKENWLFFSPTSSCPEIEDATYSWNETTDYQNAKIIIEDGNASLTINNDGVIDGTKSFAISGEYKVVGRIFVIQTQEKTFVAKLKTEGFNFENCGYYIGETFEYLVPPTFTKN